MSNVVFEMMIEDPSRHSVESSSRFYNGKFAGRKWGWGHATGGWKPNSEIFQGPRVGEELTFGFSNWPSISYRNKPNPRLLSKQLSQIFE